MSKLPLDLSKFKKVKSDQNTSVFQHADGHQISVAHGKLSLKLKEQLDKLPTDKSSGRQRFAEGTPAVPAEFVPGQSDPGPEATTGVNLANEDSQPQQAPAPDAGAQQPAQQPQTAAPEEQPVDESQTSGPDMGTNGPQQTPAQQTYAKAYQDAKAQNAAEFAKQDVLYDQDLKNGHITPETYHDLFAKKDTLGKIGTLFGLLVGGAGAGLTHQQNPILGMMDKQIDNDLQAQKQSKTNAQNWLKLQQQHDLNLANIGSINTNTSIAQYNLAKAKMLQATFHNLSDNASKLPDGPQKQAAMQTLAVIGSQVGSQISNLNDLAASANAFSKVMFGQQDQQNGEQRFQGQINSLKMMNTPQTNNIAADKESKHFPGLQGQASVPLGGADREELNSGITFQNQLNNFINWTKNHSGDISPSDRKTGQTMAAGLQGAYRQATKGGVYKEGEQNFISKLIDQEPTKFFNSIRVVPQLEAISQDNQMRVDQRAKSLGFSGYTGTQKQPQQQQDSPEIRTYHGSKYRPGKDGWHKIK